MTGAKEPNEKPLAERIVVCMQCRAEDNMAAWFARGDRCAKCGHNWAREVAAHA